MVKGLFGVAFLVVGIITSVVVFPSFLRVFRKRNRKIGMQIDRI